MKIIVKVKPNAKQEAVKKVGDNRFYVWVKAKPKQGQANQAAIRVLADYFGIAKSCVNLHKGKSAKEKLFIISDGC